MRRSRAFLVVMSAPLALAAYACSFPDVTFGPAPGEVEGGSQEVSAHDGGGITDVFAIDGNENVDPSGKDKDAATRGDAKRIPEGGCGADPCNCDDDPVDNTGCQPQGGDCDDFDPLVYPGQGFVAEPDPPRAGDWDCDNVVTKQYAVNVNCGGVSLGSCEAIEGFRGDPPCGTQAEYVFCKKSAVLCFVDAQRTTTRTQGCH